MVKSLEDYAPDLHRTYAAQSDKSWAGHDIDFWTMWDIVNAKSQYVAMQLLLVAAFGARRAEAVNFKPFIHSSNDVYIELYGGTKGGRPRIQPVDTEFKRMVIATLKEFVKAKGGSLKSHIGNPENNLMQNINHYKNLMTSVGLTKKKLGVTGHGLRSEFAIDELKKRGITAPIIGGSGKSDSPEETDLAYRLVSEQMGHSRKSVMAAYCGGFRVDLLKMDRPAEVKERLQWKDDATKELAKRVPALAVVPENPSQAQQSTNSPVAATDTLRTGRPATTETKSAQAESISDRLKQLTDFYKDGLINEQEYRDKKQEILKSL